MELKDLFLTPIYLIIIYAVAFQFRRKVTNKFTKKYFIPALTLKIVGAIALGLIYQFYYGGGDTFNYYFHSKIVTQAFYEDPEAGIRLILSQGEYDPITSKYTARMYWYTAPTEFIIVKIGAVLGVIGLNSYTIIAIFFAVASFTGIWAMYLTFLKLYPLLHKQFAIACFFIPSFFFWGSGFMKDSITVGALGWLFYGFFGAFIEKKNIVRSLVISFLAAWLTYNVKVYVLLSFLPPALFWIFNENNNKIRNAALRNILKPVFMGLGLVFAYVGATKLTEGNDKYDVDKIAERTKINSEYLTSSMVNTGSAYNIGTFDGSIGSMLAVAPQAVIVSLFRPFLWEVRNPIMLLSAMEAMAFIYLTFFLFYKTGIGKSLKLISTTPILTFSFIFSLVLAFAVGTNSGNFGTLVRYKIPLMPFYLSALYIMRFYFLSKKKKGKPKTFLSGNLVT